MNIFELLDSEEMELPKEWANEKCLFDYIRKILKSYIDVLKKVNISNINIQSIDNDCSKFLEMYKHYNLGHINESFALFQELMNEHKYDLDQLMSRINNPEIANNLYRIRKFDDNIKMDKLELFHIPFEERSKVKPYRYSVAGLPCLYLGNSIYTCWEELDRPTRILIAKFRYKSHDNITVLNLGYHPKYIHHLFNVNAINEEYLESYIKLWPLFFVSSIRVKESNRPFKPEYIIPQFLMEFILSREDIDGIRYFSTKIKKYDWLSHLNLYTNLAFPVRSSSKSGYCKILSDKFLITEPVTKLIDIKMEPLVEKEIKDPLGYILLKENYLAHYKATGFYKLEEEMKNKSFYNILSK